MKVTKLFITLSVALLLIFSCANPSLDSNAALDFDAFSAQGTDASGISGFSEEYLSNSANGEVREGYIWAGDAVAKITYLRINGVNVYQGDMLFADKDIFASEEAARAASGEGRALVNKARLWANGRVNYNISAAAKYKESQIRAAIAHIEARTKIRFTESATGNYINFISETGSWSYVGCVGTGKQDLSLADWATTGTAIHEILHALGVHHEHCRKDRDNYVIIHWSNIKAGTENNFRKATYSTQYDVGTFDFNSIMIYGPYGFAIDRTKPTITKKDGSTYTSQRDAMTATDIKGVEFLYGTGGGTTPTTDKEAPTRPTGLSSSNVTSSSVALSWSRSTDNVGVTGYKVYRNGSLYQTVSSTSVTVSGLSASTTYSFAVSAVDKAGNESLKSSSLSVKTSASGGGTTPSTEWKAYTAYKYGDIVTYQGVTYKCTMTHTAYPGWTPVAAPALWSKQ